MTSLERVLGTFAGQPVDRRPVVPLLSLYGARLTGAPLRQHFTDPEAFADGQSAVWEKFRPDVLFSPFAVSLQAAAFGARLRWLEQTPPTVERPLLTSPREAAELTLPELDRSLELRYLIAACRLLAARHQNTTPVAGVCLCPTDLPALLLGLEGWLDTLLFDRENARCLADLTLRHCVELANRLLGVGASFVLLSSITVNPGVITREILEDFTLPLLREATRRIAGPVVLHSSGAPLAGFLDLLRGLPNLVGVVVNPGEDLGLAREKAGPELTLAGNLNGPALAPRSTDAIRSEVTALLERQAGDPRFILATSAADVPLDTPPENLQALREAAEDFATRGTAASPRQGAAVAGTPVAQESAPSASHPHDRSAFCIGCSIFRREIEALQAAGRAPAEMVWESSMLHMQPKELREHLQERLEQADTEERRTFLLYGECHHGMSDQLAAHGAQRTQGLNCIEILLGRKRYRELREEGAFVLMPEWATRWREVFESELGLSAGTMRDFMRELHQKLVYLDTGQIEVPTGELEQISAAFGLPYEVEPVSLDHLAEAIERARSRAEEVRT